MPASVILEVTYAEPGVKVATNATKSATVETGYQKMFLCLLTKVIKLKLILHRNYMEGKSN
jgi:elongation factor P